MVIEAGCSQRHRILKQWEVEVDASVNLEFSDVVAQCSKLTGDIVVQCLSLRFTELRACGEAVLIPFTLTDGVG